MNNGTYQCPHCDKGFAEQVVPAEEHIKNCPAQHKTKKGQFDQKIQNQQPLASS